MNTNEIINRIVPDGWISIDAGFGRIESIEKSGICYTTYCNVECNSFNNLASAYWQVANKLNPKLAQLTELLGYDYTEHVYVADVSVKQLLMRNAMWLVDQLYPLKFEVHNTNEIIVTTSVPIPPNIPTRVVDTGYALKKIIVKL